MRLTAPALVILLAAAPGTALARPAVRADVVAGGALLAPPLEPETWGYVVGASAAVRFAELLWIAAFAETGRFPLRQPALDATAFGGSLIYDLDLAWVTPFVELGVARVSLTNAAGVGLTEWLPRLAFGVDVSVGSWLVLGAAVRYYPLFDSDLLGSPASTAVTLRMGARWQATTLPRERTSR